MNPVLYAHPAAQAAATAMSLYVLWLGGTRFLSLHLKLGVGFKRTRHALLGELTLLVWMGGSLGGLALAWLFRNSLTAANLQAHLLGAAVMAPLLVFGFGSGLYLDRQKRPRQLLPFLHGLNNLILVALALHQGWTGHLILKVLQG